MASREKILSARKAQNQEGYTISDILKMDRYDIEDITYDYVDSPFDYSNSSHSIKKMRQRFAFDLGLIVSKDEPLAKSGKKTKSVKASAEEKRIDTSYAILWNFRFYLIQIYPWL